MGKLFEGRVAIITGSGQGIGKELAKYMASEGCKVVTNNRKKGSSMQAHDGKVVKFTKEEEENIKKVIGDADSVAEEIIAAGGEAIPVYGNVCKKEDCKKLVDAAVEKWGRIDIIINNAASTWTGNIKDMTLEEWDVNIQSKLDASFYLMHYALPYMVKQHYGRILNVASSAFYGLEGMAAYSAACSGLWAFTKATAQDLANDNITVNCYTPLAATRSWFNMLAEYRAEGIPTEMIEAGSPAGMKVTPEYMVPAIAYMAAEEFTTTGIMIKVEGDGSLAIYSDPQECNACGKNCVKDGAWTVEELREVFKNQLLKDITARKTTLVITKSEY